MSAWVVPGYTEERELGRGASARVVAATHNDTGQQVAIKYLAPRLLRDPDFLARFREEVELLASIDVPHVVRLFDYVEEPGQGAAIVMELVDGVSLHEMITRQGATSPESALVVLKGSLLGLAAAHQLGIVHRDYKPENVLVDGAGNSKLTDFGVAVKAGERAPVGGTPLYMAPEQWNGEPATPATDIYAATAVFFECLTGQTPFSGRLEHLAMQHQTAAIPVALVDQPLQALIERGMAKDPRDRPAHAVEFVAELNWVADRAYGDGLGGTRPERARQARRGPAPAAARRHRGRGRRFVRRHPARRHGPQEESRHRRCRRGHLRRHRGHHDNARADGEQQLRVPRRPDHESGRRRAGPESGQPRHAGHALATASPSPTARLPPAPRPRARPPPALRPTALAHRQPLGHQPDHGSAHHRRADH